MELQIPVHASGFADAAFQVAVKAQAFEDLKEIDKAIDAHTETSGLYKQALA